LEIFNGIFPNIVFGKCSFFLLEIMRFSLEDIGLKMRGRDDN